MTLDPEGNRRGPNLWTSQFAVVEQKCCGLHGVMWPVVWCDLCFRQAATNLKDRQGWKTTNSAMLPKGREERNAHLLGSITRRAWTLSISLNNVWVCVVVVRGFFLQFWSLVSGSLSCPFWDAFRGEIISSCFPHLQHPWAGCSKEDEQSSTRHSM